MLFLQINGGNKTNSPPTFVMAIRVLIVNSHQIVLWGLEKLINTDGPNMQVVGKATNASAARQAAKEKKPDILLLDLCLEGEKCITLIPELLNEGPFHIIIFSEFHDQAIIDEAVLRGARGVVYKEEPPHQIIKAIEKVHAGELWLGRGTTGRIFTNCIRTGQKPADSIAKKIGALTRKERAIVAAFANQAGASNKKIAQNLCVSEQTLRNHLTSIFSKLELTNRFDLFMFAKLHHRDFDISEPGSAPSSNGSI